MNTTEQQTMKYENPPIDEIICGVLFESITGLRTGHLGLLWQEFGPDFTITDDKILLGPVSDEEMNYSQLPPLPRVWFVHKDENELIQVQFNRFLHNWRKRLPDDIYPGYPTIIGNFEKYLSYLGKFLEEQDLGDITPRQYELTYTNHIFENEGWETIGDLDKVFPNFISYKGHDVFPVAIRDINWQMSFSLPDDSGQLYLSIRSARRRSDKRHLLRVELRAINNRPHKELRNWFDAAHEVIADLFRKLISDEIQAKFWGGKS